MWSHHIWKPIFGNPYLAGADKIYRFVRAVLKSFGRVFPYLVPQRQQISEEEYVKTLPWKMQADATRLGLRGLMEQVCS